MSGHVRHAAEETCGAGRWPESRTGPPAPGLNEALQTRKVIGEAIGILMDRHAMTEDSAFAFLVRASSHANIKLRAVAQELVNQRSNT